MRKESNESDGFVEASSCSSSFSFSFSRSFSPHKNSSYPSRSAYASRDMPAGLGGRTSRGWRLPSAAAAAAAGAAAAAIDDVEPGGRAGAAPPPPRATPRMSLTSDMASFAASFESVCVPRASSSRERGRERERETRQSAEEKKRVEITVCEFFAHIKNHPKARADLLAFFSRSKHLGGALRHFNSPRVEMPMETIWVAGGESAALGAKMGMHLG